MINLKKLSVALKNKQKIRWIVKDGHNIILTEHYVLKTSQEIKGSALTTLIKIFGRIPVEGQGLEYRYKEITEIDQKVVKNTIDLINGHETSKSVVYTRLYQQSSKGMLTIFKGDDYIYLDKVYTDMIDWNFEGVEILGRDKSLPIYAIKGDEKMLILPFRVKEDNGYLVGGNHGVKLDSR